MDMCVFTPFLKNPLFFPQKVMSMAYAWCVHGVDMAYACVHMVSGGKTGRFWGKSVNTHVQSCPHVQACLGMSRHVHPAPGMSGHVCAMYTDFLEKKQGDSGGKV